MNKLMSKFPALGQIIRYGIVGVLNNLLGYFIYLLVTYFWLDPKVAITLLYPVRATTAYFGHSKYSFSHKVTKRHDLWRYIVAHLISYGVNYLMLYILWGKFNFPHQAVQAGAIFVCAGVLFLLFKYFVFPDSSTDNARNDGSGE
ncbi:MAG: GtrA family protein [Acetobacteraceae bacterium]|nr:GtrA family protein [Acetobacteraceae bacterium]